MPALAVLLSVEYWTDTGFRLGADRVTGKSMNPSASPMTRSAAARMSGSVESGVSLTPIVTVPVPVAMSAWSGLLRLSEKFSAPSASPSSVIGTTTVLAVSPGAKESVPDSAV